MTDKPVLNTPGELLLEAREAAGLDLHQVEERTKIPIAILRSLELDEYHKISGPLYVNSFLRTYATDVGLDPVLILDLYMKFSGEVVVVGPTPDPEAVWVDEEVEIRRIGLPWGMISAVAGTVVILVALVFWLVGSRGCSSEDGENGAGSSAESTHQSLLVEDPHVPVEDNNPGDPSATDTQVPATVIGNPPPSSDPPARILPVAATGISAFPFRDKAYWPVVLRLLCDAPVDVQVIRDGNSKTSKVSWLLDSNSYPVLPETGVQHGRPYLTREGLVVYWGARDQFSLKLDRTSGVEISLNGNVRDITNLQPGQEIILFVP